MKRSAALAAVVAVLSAALSLATAAEPQADGTTLPRPRPRVLGLSHVAFWVHDLEASRAFYKDFLGFGEPYSLGKVDGSGVHLTFIKINDLQVIELFPETQPASDRLYHVSILVDDIEAMRQFLGARGFKVPAEAHVGRI